MKSRLEMIESIYNIKPSDILALVALDKAEGTFNVNDGAVDKATRDENLKKAARSPRGKGQKSQSP